MPRRHNVQQNNSHYSGYPPSPPVQLPTPLPDEHQPVMSVSKIDVPEVVSPLIDFDTPTPPQPFSSLPSVPGLMLQSDVDSDGPQSRSPPFREAPLPEDSPPPLPIRPRFTHWSPPSDLGNQIVVDFESTAGAPFAGHSRTPNFARIGSGTSLSPVSPTYTSPTSTFENFSRTIRGYVPSSIIPASATSHFGEGLPPTPPRQGHRRNVSQQEFERDYELYEEELVDNTKRLDFSASFHSRVTTDFQNSPPVSSGLSQAIELNIERRPSEQGEVINWARWDVLNDRRLLFVGYKRGLQVWDCTNLLSVDEALNLNLDTAEWGISLTAEDSTDDLRLEHAAVLPSPDTRLGDIDAFVADRPLLGILLESASDSTPNQTIFVLYSVQQIHKVVKKLSLPGSPTTFVSNEYFTVISTTNPTLLSIFSSSTFQNLHQIFAVSLELFTPQVPHSVTHVHSTFSNPQAPAVVLETSEVSRHTKTMTPPTPSPVFALSHRLLAYASSVPSPSEDSLNISDNRRFSSPSISAPSDRNAPPFGFGTPNFDTFTSFTRADVGHAAQRVGETVLSGMKYFGGIALEAAKNRVASGQSSEVGVRDRRPSNTGRDRGGRFVSRSAPDNLSAYEESVSRTSSAGEFYSNPTKVTPSTKSSRERGHYITVIDLGGLRNRHRVSKVDEILVSTNQPTAKIEFSADGTSIAVALRDGHSVNIFKLNPTPQTALCGDNVDESNGDQPEVERITASQVYDLRRGRTSAVIETIAWAADGRYVGYGTMNRTAHIYAINPYGGKSDIESHLGGRIRNAGATDRTLTTLAPIARLRGSKSTHPETQASLALNFISDVEPAPSSSVPPLSSPNRATRSESISPLGGTPGTNFQHVLLFDPEDGMLSLYRLTLEKSPPRDPIMGGVAASFQALGVTSMSLPGTSNLGRLSTSPSAKPAITQNPPELPMELSAKLGRLATYNLRRGRDWSAVTKPLQMTGPKEPSPVGDWLAEAELSTCSNSQQIIPRSIYLSHQFFFHTLGEDYHALIRSYQLHVPGHKIDVRKEVEIRTSPWNITNFAEGFSSGVETRRDPSSFDEPILSAISGSFDNSNIPHILPMYPNGLPVSNAKKLRSSIPIKAISEGVSEGFGRIRKEMHRVRSPKEALRSGVHDASEPLEFGEDEELLIQQRIEETSREGGAHNLTTSSHILPSSQSTRKLLDADVVGTVDEELFDGWGADDTEAIDEVEQFQDLAVAGYVAEDEPKRRDTRIVRKSKSKKR